MRNVLFIVLVLSVFAASFSYAEPVPPSTPVYTTKSFGDQTYHQKFCPKVNSGFGKHKSTLKSALESGRKPCRKCKPPVAYSSLNESKAKKRPGYISHAAKAEPVDVVVKAIARNAGVKIAFHRYADLKKVNATFNDTHWLAAARKVLALEGLDLLLYGDAYHVVAAGTKVDQLKQIVAKENETRRLREEAKLKEFNKAKEALQARVDKDRAIAKQKQDREKARQKSAPPGESDQPSIYTGTGFSVSRDGHVVTAYHVVAGGSEIRLKFDGQKEWLDAEVVAFSNANDIAILKVNRRLDNYLPITDTFGLQQADRVFTIGYPVTGILGEESKYSEGYISSMSGLRDIDTLMQISVPIQPGNSGGPLVESGGSVVGVIVSTASVSAFYKYTGSMPQNINFAIKSDYINLLLKSKRIELLRPDFKLFKDPIENTKKSICYINVKA